ncbi:twin-arginine translocation signal domain-containing protein [Massilia dura]|uniref:glycerophosphodiester phosphodiesterase n=1 Tax=Pseudoduganella dura TaxID=321982 RepID=A0A6I3XMB1_9BURK|nr:glycerophosphodiester phosphodiesterase [Pseudoduganella dura]MUI14821.1 twin-arginine translocation signal domain-containing protein [Pseudoduganella dura]
MTSKRFLSRRGFIAAGAATAGAALAGSLLPHAHAAGTAVKPLVFAHRGASALRPEHTLAAYAKAIADGADFVEPDLVSTKDGVLVARHEAFLSETTDVTRRPEFAGRRVRRTIDGETHEGWFVDDFTLAELKTLRAIERIPQSRPGSAKYDGMFQVLTFEEVIDFVAAQSATIGRVIGLVPELKHSTYFARAGLPLEERFIATLAAHEYTRRAPVEIQSFEVANLRMLREKLGKRSNLRLMQLVGVGPVKPADVAADGGALTYAEMATPAGLRTIAQYADVFSPPTRALIPLKKNGMLDAPTSIAADARAAGLRLETWTFRPENRFIAADFRDGGGEHARNEAGSIAEMRRYLELGLDGFFTDDPGLGVKAVAGL